MLVLRELGVLPQLRERQAQHSPDVVVVGRPHVGRRRRLFHLRGIISHLSIKLVQILCIQFPAFYRAQSATVTLITFEDVTKFDKCQDDSLFAPWKKVC